MPHCWFQAISLLSRWVGVGWFWVDIIRLKANSVQLDQPTGTGTELGKKRKQFGRGVTPPVRQKTKLFPFFYEGFYKVINNRTCFIVLVNSGKDRPIIYENIIWEYMMFDFAKLSLSPSQPIPSCGLRQPYYQSCGEPTYMWLQHQYMWLQLQYMWLQHQYMWLQLPQNSSFSQSNSCLVASCSELFLNQFTICSQLVHDFFMTSSCLAHGFFIA